jgi:hypothetical protein
MLACKLHYVESLPSRSTCNSLSSSRPACSPWLASPDPFSASSRSAPWYSSSPFLTLGPGFGSRDARPRLVVAAVLLTFSVELLVPSNHIRDIVVLAARRRPGSLDIPSLALRRSPGCSFSSSSISSVLVESYVVGAARRQSLHHRCVLIFAAPSPSRSDLAAAPLLLVVNTRRVRVMLVDPDDLSSNCALLALNSEATCHARP